MSSFVTKVAFQSNKSLLFSTAYNYSYDYANNYYQPRPQQPQQPPPPPPPPSLAPNHGNPMQNAWATYQNNGQAPPEHQHFSQPPPPNTNHAPSMSGPGSFVPPTPPRHTYTQPHPAFSNGVPMSHPSPSNGPNNGVIRFKLQQKPQQKQNLDMPGSKSAFSSTSPTKMSQGTGHQPNTFPDHSSPSTANRTNISSNTNGSTSVQGVGAKMSSGQSDKPNNSTNSGQQWPPELHEYVTRAFAVSSDELDKDRIEIILKGKITKAINEGNMHTKDWKNEPLPVLTKASSANDVPPFSSPFKQQTTTPPKKAFRPYEQSKSVVKSKPNLADPVKGSTHSNSYSSGDYSDSSDDSDSKMKTYGKRFYHEDTPSKKKLKKKR